MIHPNIFKPRNDWAVISMNCKKSNVICLEAIIGEVLNKTGITKGEFTSRCRSKGFVEARQLYFYRARQLTTYSLKTIGSKVQSGDHSTVIYGIRQVATVPSLRQKYNELFNGAEHKEITKVEPKPKPKDESKVYLPINGVPNYN